MLFRVLVLFSEMCMMCIDTSFLLLMFKQLILLLIILIND